MHCLYIILSICVQIHTNTCIQRWLEVLIVHNPVHYCTYTCTCTCTHACNRCTMYIKRSIYAHMHICTCHTLHTCTHAHIHALSTNTLYKTSKCAYLHNLSSVWHVEYAPKYAQIHIWRGTPCWNSAHMTLLVNNGLIYIQWWYIYMHQIWSKYGTICPNGVQIWHSS